FAFLSCPSLTKVRRMWSNRTTSYSHVHPNTLNACLQADAAILSCPSTELHRLVTIARMCGIQRLVVALQCGVLSDSNAVRESMASAQRTLGTKQAEQCTVV